MDKRKLTGMVLAVLTVSVLEGEVRVGNAEAAEAKVADGEKGVVSAAGVETAATSGPAANVVLGETSYWRWYAMSRPPVYLKSDADKAGERARVFGRTIPAAEAEALTPAPPAGWNQPDFDDRDWPRSLAKNLATEACRQISDDECIFMVSPGHGVGGMLARGRFNVKDPKKAGNLAFSLSVTGGAAVYVNGKKLAAVGLPEGEVAANAPALPYGEEAYLDTAGHPMAFAVAAPIVKRGTPKETLDTGAVERVEKRKRTVRVHIPADALRPGVNVVAVEFHRSDFNEAAKAWGKVYAGYQYFWPHLWVWGLSLSDEANGAVDRNVERPQGFQVWNLDRNVYLTEADYGDPTEPLRPITLVGARNGTFWGRVVASSQAAIKGLKAEATELTGPGGAIPAKQITIRYSDEFRHSLKLDDLPPKEMAPKAAAGAACSVWVSVRTPKDLAAGTYKGTLTVSAEGETAVKVPVEVSVADWTIPDPVDFRTRVGIYESPSTLSIQYKVPMWSEEHWKLLDKSFELLGGLGCKFANLSVVDQGYAGEKDGAVIWKKKADGTYDYDLTILERYLKLVKKHLGKCPYIALGIMQRSGGWGLVEGKVDPGTTVPMLDPATGKKEPLPATPQATPESEAFWRPALLAIREAYKREGLESSLCIGFVHGDDPPKPVRAMFDGILGGKAGFVRNCHPPAWNYAYDEAVYIGAIMADPGNVKAIAKQLQSPGMQYWRAGTEFDLMTFRTLPDWSICHGRAGFAHVGLDYWPTKDEEGKDIPATWPKGRNAAGVVFGRWPRDNGWPGGLCPPALSTPGPDGARPTPQYESLREGLQEFDAMISILDAAQTQSAKIGDELTNRGKALFAEKWSVLRRSVRTSKPPIYTPDSTAWQDLSRRTYALAAEIEKAMKK